MYIGRNRVEHFENISYIAGEGTALTLLGTVTYNSDTNQIQLTKVAAIVAGGVKESINYLKSEIQYLSSIRLILGVTTLLCFSINGFLMYQKNKEKRASEKAEQDQLNAQKLVKSCTLRRFPTAKANEQGIVCLVCLTNPSNVVAIPCNHLATCNECYYKIK